MDADAIVDQLRTLGNPADLQGMRRYGVGGTRAFGVKVGPLRDLARSLKARLSAPARHVLALDLWASGWREARLVAAMIDAPGSATLAQIESWLRDVDSWDVCDGLCSELIRRTPWAWDAVPRWCRDGHEYVRRGGFVTLAVLAVHDRKAPDERFLACFDLVVDAAGDGRNAVKKGVNWAIRQVGKRNVGLNAAAIVLAERLATTPAGPAARWIAADALRELRSHAVQERLARRGSRVPPA